ncbi:MAG: hypothetical protein KAI47_07445 [Deltaproteobacteria bacterium]|nr:hypothetical protein [Deltaproteobacteria bacterium]
MWQSYMRISAEHAFTAAFVQFMVLGLFGEVLSTILRTGEKRYPFSLPKTVLKMIAWGLLGVYIKIMFLTAVAGVKSLAAHAYLPQAVVKPHGMMEAFLAAVVISTLLNVLLGPSMMILHRVTDNTIHRLLRDPSPGWAGLDRSLKTLLWLWIPLHTITFMQAKELRIGIAAVLSLLLGIVLGWFNRPTTSDNTQERSA